MPGQRVCCNQFQQQNFSQLYQNTHLEVTPNLYFLRSAHYVSKLSLILLAQKLLIKWWWNWPQFLFLSLLHMDMMHFRLNRFEEKTYELNWFEGKNNRVTRRLFKLFQLYNNGVQAWSCVWHTEFDPLQLPNKREVSFCDWVLINFLKKIPFYTYWALKTHIYCEHRKPLECLTEICGSVSRICKCWFMGMGHILLKSLLVHNKPKVTPNIISKEVWAPVTLDITLCVPNYDFYWIFTNNVIPLV